MCDLAVFTHRGVILKGLVCDLVVFTHQGVILKGLVCDSGGFTHHDAQGPGPKIPPCVFWGVLQ